MMKRMVVSALVMSMLVGAARAASDDLAKNFVNPPDEAKPRVYWWWLNSLVSKEGITRDLEEYKAKGVGGVLLFDAGGAAGAMPSGPTFMGPEWREMVKHALSEADRLGLEVSINLCSGWDAGGPWITPQYGCKHVVQSRLMVKGPRRFSGKLPPPPGDGKSYRDIAVQALPVSGKHSGLQPSVKASSCQPPYPVANAVDGSEQTFWVSNGWKPGEAPTREKPEWILVEFAEPVKTKTLWLTPQVPYGPREIELQVSEDGRTFTTLKAFSLENKKPGELLFPETTSRYFRILITSSYAVENTQVAEVSLTGRNPLSKSKGSLLAYKNGRDSLRPAFTPIRQCLDAPLSPLETASDETPVAPGRIVDLTVKVGPDGTLEWDVPEGSWMIVRTGVTITGKGVSCSSPGGGGLEMDFLGAGAMDHHFKSMAGVLIREAGPLAGKSLKYFHDDSWEVEMPNWTDGFLDRFLEYRGYDARTYLPVLDGVPVGDAAVSDRFLYDYRKTIADCLTENHYRRFAALSHAQGVGIHPESGGPCYPTMVPMDALRNLGCGDIPMGEFWQDGNWKEQGQNAVAKQTASAAHIYGKQWVAAEAFTSMGPHWEESPVTLKPTADIAFCEGVNRFFCHTSTSTRPEDGKPGYEYFAGTHFNRNVTWWEQSGAWLAYLARCQYLLSQGLFVGDVCYYYGDWAPNFVEPKHVDPSLGKGYDYDVCNAEVLLSRLSVKDGRLVLPDGMSYRLLVLPERRQMPVEVIGKIRTLVKDGATVVGPKPESDPGLKNYPKCDAEVTKIAFEVWGDLDGKQIKERTFGKGRVVWGKTLREILLTDGVQPDFELSGSDAFIDFIHRTVDGADVYFLANRNNRSESVTCLFRVAGRQPELWNPVTGEKRDLPEFEQKDGRTIVPLAFEAHGSMFVVFRGEGTKVQSGKGTEQKRNFPEVKPVMEITGAWTVLFDPKWFYDQTSEVGGQRSEGITNVVFEKLEDWTKRPEEAIKYYSGTATYRKVFDLQQSEIGNLKSKMHLALGEVRNLARVRLNGKALGTVWCAPWRVEITGAVKEKGNELEIEVVNLWPNRLIGDGKLPPEKRRTKTNVSKFSKGDHQPLASGLLGPVQIVREF